MRRTTSPTSLSRHDGMPSGRSLPFFFGIYTLRAGANRYRSNRIRSMISSICASDMPSAVPPAGPRRHRPLVGVDVAVGSKVQVLVEHLPVKLREWQALPAALAENSKYHCGVLHYASLMVP